MDKVDFNNLSTYEEKLSWIKDNANSDSLERYLNYLKKETKKDCYRRINKILNNNENSIITMLPEEDLDKMYERRIKDKYKDLDKETSFKVNKIISSYSKEDDPDLNKMYDELLKILPEDSSFYKKIKERKSKLLTSSLMPYESLRKIEKKNKEEKSEPSPIIWIPYKTWWEKYGSKKERKMENKENKERTYMETDTNSYTVRKNEDRSKPRFDREKIMDAVKMLIEAIGDDPNREGLIGTPDRVARMYEELFEGMSYTNDQIAEMFNTSFETSEENEDLVTVGQIPIGSFCEHHLMPMVNMTASIGYIPVKGRVVGLSKLARIAMLAASRLQLQEKIGEDIAYIVQKVTGSPDVIVVIEGEHTCMTMRGIKARGSLTRTATLRGRFRDNVSLRQEFYSLIKV